MNKKPEFESRGEDVVKLTTEEKKEYLKRMLHNAGIEEDDIKNEMVEKLTTKELNDYYRQYEEIIKKHKTKKL